MFRKILFFPVLLSVLIIFGCGGGGGGGSPSSSITGTISAPNAQIAFGDSHSIFAKLINLLFSTAIASGTSTFTPAGAGTIVNLIQVDDKGAQVGPVIATGTTNASGSYTLKANSVITPAANLIIQAVGSNGTNLNSIVTGSTVNVDPTTDAAQSLIVSSVQTNQSSLSSIPINSVIELHSLVAAQTNSVVYSNSSTTSAGSASTALVNAVKNDQEVSNSVASIASSGTITGTVTDSNGAPLSGITIQLMTSPYWLRQTSTTTNSSGQYTINAPLNTPYILGAINTTSTSTGASQWFTSSGGTSQMFAADVITLPNSSIVTKNFILQLGGIQLFGKISGGGNPLTNIKFTVRDFLSNEPVFSSRTICNSDGTCPGTYSVTVAPGKYYLGAFNDQTLSPYASGFYGTAGNIVANNNSALPITLTSNQAATEYDFALNPGVLVTGKVTDPAASTTGLSGVKIEFYDADPNANMSGSWAGALRTNPDGTYGYWLQAKTSTTPFYIAMARGQTLLVNTKTFDSGSTTTQTLNFSSAVAQITGKLVDTSGNPIPQAKIFVYTPNTPIALSQLTNASSASSATNTNTNVGFNCASYGSYTNNSCWLDLQITGSDGTFTVYSSAATIPKVKLLAKIDNGSPYATVFYSATNTNPTQISLADNVTSTINSTTTLPSSFTMPPGVVISGTITNSNTSAPAPNFGFQLRGFQAGEDFKCTYLTTPSGSYNPSSCTGGTAAVGYPTHQYISIGTRSDGTFSLSVLPGTYYARINNGYNSYFDSGLTTWQQTFPTSSSASTVSNTPAPFTVPSSPNSLAVSYTVNLSP